MEAAIWAIALVAGAFAGSFLNVVIHRGPAMWGLVEDDATTRGNLMGPRSYCPACRAPIPRAHLLPLVSFAALGGKCAACAAPIPLRYPLVELAGVIVVAIAIWRFGLTAEAGFAGLLGLALIALAAIDFETGYLPDMITLPLMVAGLAINLFSTFAGFSDALIGLVVGAGLFWALGAFWSRLRGVEALGLGDAKLLGGLGAWAGWQALPLIVFVAAAATLVIVLIARLRGQAIQSKDPVPFGPGLCFAGYGVFVSGVVI
ncbi:MAG: prepilin peptidase [Pseudomonadota bacterium]